MVLQERFLKYSQYSVYRAAIQTRGKALFSDSEQSKVDWERVSLQNCFLFQDRKILAYLTNKLLCFVNPEFESNFNSQSYDSSLDAKTIHQFLLVLLDLFLRNKFFSILQFLGNILLDFPGRVHCSFPILQTRLFLSEPDQPIDSSVVVVIVGTRTRNVRISLFQSLTSTPASASYDLC